MIRFVHSADIHLDSPLRGLESYPGAPVERIRGATRQALQRLVDFCLAERVDFLLVAGDLFDVDWRDFHTALFVAEQMRRLNDAKIPVLLILGNHDSHEEMTRRTPWPANVHVFSHTAPETFVLESSGVVVHGMSFPKREVLENLVPRYPQATRGAFNIGLLHTSASGNPNHDTYAPCGIPELCAKEYDYWALGHVHDYQVLHERPHVVYSGNLQGRHAREVGAKGAVLVTVDEGEVSLQFQPLDVLRWSVQTVQLADDDDLDELLDRARQQLQAIADEADGRFSAVRLEFEGRCRAHKHVARDDMRQQLVTDLRALASDIGADVWIEKIRFRTGPPIDVEALRQGADVVGELLRELDAMAANTQSWDGLTDALQPLVTKVATELNAGGTEKLIDFFDEQQVREWLRDAERILIERLVGSNE